jgi:transposase
LLVAHAARLWRCLQPICGRTGYSSQARTPRHRRGLSQAGCDGGLISRVLSPGEGKGFRSMPRPRKYPPELLDRGARLVFESGRPIAHVARDLGVPSETLRMYVRRIEADQGLRPDLPSAAEREEIKRPGCIATTSVRSSAARSTPRSSRCCG